MGGGGAAAEAANPNPRRSVNPNWAQLQQKLESRRANKPSRRNPSADPVAETLPPSVLGKRKERAEPAPEPPLLTVLSPTSADGSLTDTLAMDCEMVGVSSDGTKSALGRATLVNSWGNVVYDEYVRPMERIVDFRTRISGIRPRNMKKAKEFWAVQKEVAELIKGRTLVGHALHNDLKVLLLSHPKKDTRDTAEYEPLRRDGRSRALKHLAAEILGVKIQEKEHCPVEDARAAMFIYIKYKKEWEKSMKKQIKLKEKLNQRKKKKKKKKMAAKTTDVSITI
ncbi:RNA exonuclease 4 [Canna indica]|uniref:RNA exonuclease 4 n=1 Tax=Canna indica TaxID=4628 RepID=A0AAQ3K346_9LILI|nr:RNA exonuclease 4 [Canna indica]